MEVEEPGALFVNQDDPVTAKVFEKIARLRTLGRSLTCTRSFTGTWRVKDLKKITSWQEKMARLRPAQLYSFVINGLPLHISSGKLIFFNRVRRRRRYDSAFPWEGSVFRVNT